MQPNDLYNSKVPQDGNFIVPGDGTFKHWMAYIYQVQQRNLNLASQFDGLSKNLAAMAATQKTLVDLLSKQTNMDAAEIGTAVEAAVSKALQDNIVHVTVDVNGDEQTPAAQ